MHRQISNAPDVNIILIDLLIDLGFNIFMKTEVYEN